MQKQEIIEYRGCIIYVSQIRDHLQRFKNKDGTPYYTFIELEEEVKKKIIQRKREIGRITGARQEKNEGYRLSFYLKERQLYSEAFETKIEDAEAEKLVRKLFRHFYKREANRCMHVRFYGNRQGGSFGWGIRLSHNPSIGLICHEVAHWKFKRHTNKMLKFIGKLVKYCKKKGYMK